MNRLKVFLGYLKARGELGIIFRDQFEPPANVLDEVAIRLGTVEKDLCATEESSPAVEGGNKLGTAIQLI